MNPETRMNLKAIPLDQFIVPVSYTHLRAHET